MSQSQKLTKILYIITQGQMGGAQRYVFDLAANINNPPQSPLNLRGGEKGGYEILVAIGEGGSELKLRLERQNIPVKMIKHLRRNIHPISELLAILELKKLISEFQPDIVHLNSSKAGVLGSLAAGLAGHKNVVFTAHGFAFLEPHLFRFIYFWAEKLASYFRKIIITVSETDRMAAIKSKLCAPEKLITIHNGIDLTTSPGLLAALPTPGEGKITLGTIAHDYPTKDLNTLRQAFEIVKKDHPDAELKIISGVPDAASHLSEFDIYVCSSIKEGFPYTILEAMASGLPIVSTSVGGIPEAIENEKQGLLVPPKNPKALAKAIERLLSDRALAKSLGENAHKKVQDFSLDRMVARTEEVYQKLLRF